MKKLDINENILKALDELGYLPLKDFQEETFSFLSLGHNIFLHAPTGSGKTAAYLIPLLSGIDAQANQAQVLIIAPTRELALQISKVANAIASYTSIHCVTLIGGLDIKAQTNALHHRPHVIVATCGRLLDLFEQNAFHHDSLKTIVFDEADMLYTSGQLTDAKKLLDHLNNAQRVFVSATGIDTISSLLPDHYEIIRVEESEQRITNYHIECNIKEETLYELLNHLPITSGIVFTTTKQDAEKLNVKLQKKGILSEDFSSQYSEKQRIQVLERFKNGNTRILVATDAAARGLDIQDVSHVIHFHLPEDKETWIHRSGRSGHQGQTGISVVLLDKEDFSNERGMYYLQHTHPLTVDVSLTNDLTKQLKKKKEGKTSTGTFLIRAGKKEKLRPKDIIGSLCTIVDFKEIGKLEIQDTYSLVDIYHPERITQSTISIKGKQRKLERYRNK